LAGCSIYSNWDPDLWASSSESNPCPGTVRAGIKVDGAYTYSSWKPSAVTLWNVSGIDASSHYSAYRS